MDRVGNAGTKRGALTAREAGLVACRTCGRLARQEGRCPRCGAALRSRDPLSVQRSLAWLLAGIVAYIPANLYPMLITRTLGDEDRSTIVGGVIELLDHGAYFVAIVVGVASVLVPVGKFVVIGMLIAGITRVSRIDPHHRLHLYEIVEFIGRWSMIDVFVVAILVALVQLDFVATVNPGLAAISFAASVVFTMLSAQALDPRLIWDERSEHRHDEH